jgi:Calx-beta domain-containing protein
VVYDCGMTKRRMPARSVVAGLALVAAFAGLNPGAAAAAPGPCAQGVPCVEVSNSIGCWELPADNCRVRITVPEVLPIDVMFRVTTMDGTATAPEDYGRLDLPVTIRAGERGVDVPVEVRADRRQESEEDFLVIVSWPAAAGVAIARAQVTITDEPPPRSG